MNGSEDHDLLIELRSELRAIRERFEEAERREIERLVRAEVTVEKLYLTVTANSNKIANLEVAGVRDGDRVERMWNVFAIGRFVIPFVLVVQPLLIAIGTWMVQQ